MKTERYEIVTHPELPGFRYMAIDTLTDLKFDEKNEELTVSVSSISAIASIAVEQKVVASELIHSARISEEGHVFPILRTTDSKVSIAFDELKGYQAVCNMCGIEPNREVSEKARFSEAESLE
ncbi:hypothetical protein [Vibrio coralliilyticus]|uniref:hypothetical protein n=1 Tax=Vibrio coralliilyticus TaxID=190893 RepID=UPI001E4C2B96|nr:hypothetical protein [Vibrio coralliilyticus]MCC2525015.1 hypothetical protein [Vibrio coralliilyticus]